MTQLTHKQQQLFNALSIVVGNAMYALTVVLFLMPSGLITGGATGIALAFNKVTGLPVSAVLFVVNVVMLLLGWWVLGSRFALNTMASTVLSPFFMALWERLLGNLVLTDDLVLNTVFAGFGIGISLGITIRAGASTGGMDHPPAGAEQVVPPAGVQHHDGFRLYHSGGAGGLQPGAAVPVRRGDGYHLHGRAGQGAHAGHHPHRGKDHQRQVRRDLRCHLCAAGPRCDHPARRGRLPAGAGVGAAERGLQPAAAKAGKLAHAIDPTCFMIVSHVTEVSGRGFSLEKDYQAEG